MKNQTASLPVSSPAIIRQAIITRVLPATNFRGYRYTARCERGSITLGENDSLTRDENHVGAAKALCARFIAEDVQKYGEQAREGNPWSAPFSSGVIMGGDFCHVFND